MRKLLERFNDLPGPMKDFIVKAGAVALVLKATGAGSFIGGFARLAAKISLSRSEVQGAGQVNREVIPKWTEAHRPGRREGQEAVALQACR